MQKVSVWHVRATIPLTAVAVPICGLFCVAMSFILFSREGLNGTMNKRLSITLLSLLSAELILNYIAPVYYFFNKLPILEHNAYAGAPYLQVLKNGTVNYDRVFARDGVLFPDWASAFELFDIRDLDALFYKKYFPFLRNFIPGRAGGNDLFDRFTGTGDYDLSTPQAQGLFQISSVKYIGSTRLLVASNAIVEDILKQNQQLLTTGASAYIRPAILPSVEMRGKGWASILPTRDSLIDFSWEMPKPFVFPMLSILRYLTKLQAMESVSVLK